MTTRAHPTGLWQLARAWGVQTSYHDYQGTRRTATPEAVLATLATLGAPVASRADVPDALRDHEASRRKRRIEPVRVAWDGSLESLQVRSKAPPHGCRIRLEDGSIGEPAPLRTRRAAAGMHDLELGLRLPQGYHQLEVELDGEVATTAIIAAPRRAPDSVPGSWGVFLPLHTFRTKDSDCVGDFGDLARALDWTVSHGGHFVGTLPLLPVFLEPPAHPSPYTPVSRLFWNELFVDVRGGPAAEAVRARADWRRRRHRCDVADFVDYEAAAAVKRELLEAEALAFFAADGPAEPAFRKWLAERPEALEYAAFRSAGERAGRNWRLWAAADPPGRAIASLDGPGRYHLYGQWLAEEQLAAAAAGRGGLYLDLPLGVHPDGYDAWRTGALLAHGASAGAPPDALFNGGQDWGFQPVRPAASRATAHAYWRDSLRHHLRHASVLRLDHAMSLERLYWIPAGFPPTEGVYVRYPTDELVAVLTLEANRAGAVIVGEDLGTVSRPLRRTMARHRLHRMYVFQFETDPAIEEPLRPQPTAALAALDTHDLPTFAAFWKGLDLVDQHELGLLDDAAFDAARRERRELRVAVAHALGLHGGTEGADAADVIRPLLLRLAAGRARLLAINLEDLWLEERPLNVPGTSTERPNWRRRAARSLDDIFHSPELSRTLRAVARTRSRQDHG